MQYDVFISHASEDKESIVRGLANALLKIGCTVWYDEFSLRPGDSLSRSIDRGLAQSRFGIVVLSDSFLAKAWPEYELRGLTTRENNGKTAILPILHGIDIKHVADYSPTLADKVSLDTSKQTPDELVAALLRVVRPDIHRNLAKTLLAQSLHAQTGQDWCRILEQVNPPTGLPVELTSCQIVRLRMIRGLLHPFLGEIPIAKWLDLAAHQEDPELDLLWWENLCVIWMEFASVAFSK